MDIINRRCLVTAASLIGSCAIAVGVLTPTHAQEGTQRGATSYAPVDIKEAFPSIMERFKAAKPAIQMRQADLLADRYDLSNRAAAGVTMSRGKPVQEGVRVELPAGTNWDQLTSMNPTEISDKNLFPKGFYPLPHPNHQEGGMVFPKIRDRGNQETGRARPHPLRPRFRPARPLPARVSAAHLPDHPARPGRRVAGQAGHHRQLLRAVQRHSEPQADRGAAPAGDAVPAAAVQPDRGSPLGEGEPRGDLLRLPRRTATPTGRRIWSGDIRPQEHRHRIETPSLRGVNIQRLFGSQRALKIG